MKRPSGPRWHVPAPLCAVSAAAVVLASCLPRGAAPAAAAKANARCTECHLDFLDEGLTVAHQGAGVTCVRCHGHSQPHIDDEVRETKPDATFRGQAMAVFCLTCHEPAGHAAIAAHAANLRGEPAKRKACTQCHGEHKLLPIES